MTTDVAVTGEGQDREAIRRAMRARRRRLRAPERQRRAASVAANAVPRLGGTGCVAAYVAVDGEVDPAPIIQELWAADRPVALPVLDGPRLAFRRHHRDVALVAGALGVPVPPPDAATVEVADLDVVLVPLVAFDRRGTRLGTGGGHYDRTFAAVLADPPRRPALVGLAYAFQEVDRIERQSWDVPLDRVVTEREVIATAEPAHRAR